MAADSYYNCQSQCQGTDDCNYFTYYDPNNICVLQYNCTEIDTSNCPQCFTGERDCPVCSIPGECQGNLVGQTVSDTEEDCQRECFNDPDCLWYTYDFVLSYCLLTSDCFPRNSTSQKTYGQKNCYQDNGDGTNPSSLN